MLPPGPHGRADHAAFPGQCGATDGHPLVHQRALGDPPARTDIPDPVHVPDHRAGQEHLVELGFPGELAERPDLHPGPGHVAAEVGQPGVLGHVRVGAREQQAPLRVVRHRRPHLLPVDHPLPAVRPVLVHRAGGQAGQVRARARLTEQLAPDLLSRPEWPQPARFLFFITERQNRGRGHP